MNGKQKTGETRVCEHCGKEVYVRKYRLETFKYCSRKCLALAARVVHTKNCEICGSEFTHIASRANKAKYCSRKCYYKAMKLVGSIIKNCKTCGKEFKCSPSHKDKEFCSARCDKDNRILNSKAPKTFTSVRKWMLVRGMLDRCADCGYDKYKELIGVHHIDENRNNNSLENLVPLCPNCHSERHMKHVVHNTKPTGKKYF